MTILIGSDMYRETSIPETFMLLETGLFTPAELLTMLAVTTPRAVCPNRRIGALAPGYETSFLVLETNPLESLDAIRKIRLRIKRGVALPSSQPPS